MFVTLAISTDPVIGTFQSLIGLCDVCDFISCQNSFNILSVSIPNRAL